MECRKTERFVHDLGKEARSDSVLIPKDPMTIVTFHFAVRPPAPVPAHLCARAGAR